MADDSEYVLPKWEPRVTKLQIERLYKSVGNGIVDEELINDVGYSLFARCQSILKVCEAVIGRPHCPKCDTAIESKKWEEEIIKCPKCDWTCPWKAYQKTYKHRGLFVGGLKHDVREFVDRFENSHSPSDRLILIDSLLHRFHWEQVGSDSGRPGVASLIEGKMKEIMEFLDRLSYGDHVPAEVSRTREEWRKKWSENPWSKGRGR